MAKALIVLAVGCTAYLAAADDDLSNVSIRFYSGSTTDETADYSITTGEDVVRNSGWDSSKQTVLLFHGVTESVESTSIITMASAYLQRSDHNVIAINYPDQSTPASWKKSDLLAMVENANLVGTAVGELINRLIKADVDLSTIHLVGYMIGAHVAGKAARTVDGTIENLVALDPLNWGFYLNDNEDHLQKTDSNVVQVIHTNGLILGVATAVGTVDFFPNSGYALQPGCWTPYSTYTAECSSRTAYQTYAVSVIDPTAFEAISCSIWTEFEAKDCTGATDHMGFGFSKKATGNFYLQTVEEYPYSKGTSGIVWSGSEAQTLALKFLNYIGYIFFSSCC